MVLVCIQLLLFTVLVMVNLQWSPYNFILGSSFLTFLLITRFLVSKLKAFSSFFFIILLQILILQVQQILVLCNQGKRNRKIFWLPAIAPLISVILSTLIVFLTRADEHGVKIVKHIKGGLNPSSVHQLQFDGPHASEVVKIGLIVAVIALTVQIPNHLLPLY